MRIDAPDEVRALPQTDILAEGLQRLCRTDPAIENIINCRFDTVVSLLSCYAAEIEKYNPALSLVGTDDRRELIIRHVLDSLAPLGIISRKCDVSRVADVGSGAGLPGIPLAVALPDSKLTLIERKGRRAGFLRETQAELGLPNVTVEEEEMEKVRPGRFSLVVFRAFRPLEPKILKKLFRLCAGGGVLAAYKGRFAKTETEVRALEEALPDFAGRWEIIPCTVPMLDEERHLLLLYL